MELPGPLRSLMRITFKLSDEINFKELIYDETGGIYKFIWKIRMKLDTIIMW